MTETFREFYEAKHGKYPGIEGEHIPDVMERIADTMAEYIERRLPKRTAIRETAAGYEITRD